MTKRAKNKLVRYTTTVVIGLAVLLAGAIGISLMYRGDTQEAELFCEKLGAKYYAKFWNGRPVCIKPDGSMWAK